MNNDDAGSKFDENGRNAFGQTPFLEACWSGNVAKVEKMLAENARVVDERDTVRNQTALHIVCHRLIKNFSNLSHWRYWKLWTLLLQKSDIDVDAQDSQQWTALHYLLCNQLRTDWLLNEIDVLLARKPSVTLQDNQGRTVEDSFPLFSKHFAFCNAQQRFVLRSSLPPTPPERKTILKKILY